MVYSVIVFQSALDQLRKTLFKTIVIVERERETLLQQEKEIEIKSAETIGGRIFKHWDELIQSTEGCWGGGRSLRLGCLCLLIVTSGSLAPTLPQKLEYRGAIFFGDYISKG